MGIASGIFWIMAGLLYILYQALKEHPAETLVGIVYIVGIIGFLLLGNWLIDLNPIIGGIAYFGALGFIIYKVVKYQRRENEKTQKSLEEYEQWMRKVRATLTEKDYEDYARKNAWKYYANMNENSPLYWKKEPYYSKIVWAVEAARSVEMRKSEELEKQGVEMLQNQE